MYVRVLVHWLQTASEHNDKLGSLVEFLLHSGRWKVELAGGAPRQCIHVKPANLSPASLPASDDDEEEEDEEEEEKEEKEEQVKQGEDVVLPGGVLESLAANVKMAEEKVATPAQKEANQRRLRRHLRAANAAWGGDGTLTRDEFVAAMTTLDCNGKGISYSKYIHTS
jgi:hypothetical protein